MAETTPEAPPTHPSTPPGPQTTTGGQHSSAGLYDKSYVWMVQLLVFIVWMVHAIPIVRKFFGGGKKRGNIGNKKLKKVEELQTEQMK